ncbi:TOG array regulator of axonemal microtubules protein 1-like [Pangasianodon hypophthalmus]|uniref:TOG array regulator of axonemal microtubules protein 1-like n=1 Tax=Pangasianodon hypophthalmus TaxID=310915 RepID=UPI0023078085|nr:TOG array regulator of axonemal microtubules protein 1-like [Pangasianodon hypophthalmus]
MYSVNRMETNKRASMTELTRQKKLPALGNMATKMEPVACKIMPPFHLEPASNVAARKPAVVSHKKEEEVSYEPVDNMAASRPDKLQDLGLISEKPLARPVEALDELFQLLKLQDLQKKMEGLKVVRALAEHHPDILLPSLHDVCLAVLKEVENRRTTLTHAAIITMTHLFAHLRKEMDKECERTATVLLYRVSEAIGFIREKVDMALSAMVYSCSPVHVMNALLKGGLSHPDPLVRKHMVLHLDELTQVAGASCLLTGKKNATGRFVSDISKLALDAAQEVRYVAEFFCLFPYGLLFSTLF